MRAVLRGKALLLVATAAGSILLGAAISFRADLLPRLSVHDVAWFKAHGAERSHALLRCRGNPGLARNNPNCANAQEAAVEISFQNERQAARRELGIE